MTPYRAENPERFYLCPGCSSPERASLRGGQVTCSRCRAPCTLPDRNGLPLHDVAPETLAEDPARIQQLRLQGGRPRQVSATLQAVLGGTSILPGREQESLTIWQSLRTRSSQGDVAASEDLSMLTLLIDQAQLATEGTDLGQALSESAFDAVVLPRHKQEQLGHLARRAIGRGDRAAAQRYLGWMIRGAPDLETDSELRVSTAALATLDRDGRRVLALIGPTRNVIPIAESLDPVASVLRANAHELLGDLETAAGTLRALADPRDLARVSARYPALQLCAQACQVYDSAVSQESAKRAAASANDTGFGPVLGIVLGGIGLLCLGVGVFTAASDAPTEAIFPLALGVPLTLLGGLALRAARRKARRAAWLRVHGLSLPAHVTGADATGAATGETPVYRFTVEVAGPEGPYTAAFLKLIPEHEVAALIGRTVRVRAAPENLTEIIVEE
jgi:hypothetical protein